MINWIVSSRHLPLLYSQEILIPTVGLVDLSHVVEITDMHTHRFGQINDTLSRNTP